MFKLERFCYFGMSNVQKHIGSFKTCRFFVDIPVSWFLHIYLSKNFF